MRKHWKILTGTAVVAVVAISLSVVLRSEQPTVPDHAQVLATNAYDRFLTLSEAQDEILNPHHVFLTANGMEVPAVLSAKDKRTYREIFRLETRGEWPASDKLAAGLSDKTLLGHVLAQRYLSPAYNPDFGELVSWLKTYPSLPQAESIRELALNSRNGNGAIPEIQNISSLSGYGDDNGLHRQSNQANWSKGLREWEAKNYKDAALSFSKAYASDQSDSPWERAAAAYWAARAFRATGDSKQAIYYLQRASEQPRTFYGILASRTLGKPLSLELQPTALTEEDLENFSQHSVIRRAIALAEISEPELADREMRLVFNGMNADNREKLLSLACALDLPSVQITMARALSHTNPDRSYDFALYPRPKWEPEKGFNLDPALVFAFARQESGFRISAQSSYGAIGLMQLMPRTAHLVNRRTKLVETDTLTQAHITQPSLNLTLGQSYIVQLMNMDAIDRNLLLTAAAYNAGPGKVMQWRQELSYSGDPLLFLERIPTSQTRHYVMQVMTNYWIYAMLDGRKPETANALAQNRWPTYSKSTTLTADAVSSAKGKI